MMRAFKAGALFGAGFWAGLLVSSNLTTFGKVIVR